MYNALFNWVSLVSTKNNTFITNLDLEDNWLEGEGGEYVARMLKENCYITELVGRPAIIVFVSNISFFYTEH